MHFLTAKKAQKLLGQICCGLFTCSLLLGNCSFQSGNYIYQLVFKFLTLLKIHVGFMHNANSNKIINLAFVWAFGFRFVRNYVIII